MAQIKIKFSKADIQTMRGEVRAYGITIPVDDFNKIINTADLATKLDLAIALKDGWLDTVSVEALIDCISQWLIGSRWPTYRDTKRFKKVFFTALEQASFRRGWKLMENFGEIVCD